MGKLTVTPVTVDPPFDLGYYLQVSGTTRVEQPILELFESNWKDFAKELRARRFARTGSRQGHVLIYLEKTVEEAVEAAWQRSPSQGFALHNLAICLVMSAARDLIPEVEAGACAPLPKPDRDIRRQFEKMGLVWDESGSINRSYAVFTPQPYAGGCAVCHLRQSCPRSDV